MAIAAKVNQPGYVSLKPKKNPKHTCTHMQRAIPAVDQGLVGRLISYYFDDLQWYEGIVHGVQASAWGRKKGHEA